MIKAVTSIPWTISGYFLFSIFGRFYPLAFQRCNQYIVNLWKIHKNDQTSNTETIYKGKLHLGLIFVCRIHFDIIIRSYLSHIRSDQANLDKKNNFSLHRPGQLKWEVTSRALKYSKVGNENIPFGCHVKSESEKLSHSSSEDKSHLLASKSFEGCCCCWRWSCERRPTLPW